MHAVARQAHTNDSLRGKQKLFIQEYLVDLNATKAAVRAGYSKRSARQIGSEILAKPHVKAAIDAALLERSKRTQIAADRVISELAAIAFANPANLIRVGEEAMTPAVPKQQGLAI